MSNSNWKILVVDDQEFNIKILRQILEKNGYQVLAAMDGKEARELASTENPDLVLLDIMMPDESGFQTCEQLKADPATADIPVIFLSALEDVESKVQGFNIGGVDYVTKPFQHEEILARVKTHLKLKHAYQRIIEEQAERLKHIQKAQLDILIDPASFPEANFGVCYVPLQEAGGDFYDVFRVGGEHFGYFIGDISGHDLLASFNTSALKALVRQNFDSLSSPQESMKLINRVLISIFSGGQHLTAAYVDLDRSNNKLTFVSAAHPPLIYVQSGAEARPVSGEGDVMGVFAASCFEPVGLHGKKGDRFFLYSDGLIESINRDINREEGIRKLAGACEGCRDLDIRSAPGRIVQDLVPDPERNAQDDILLMGVEL
mgnify:FL=1